jgi:hypothetical protein
VTIRHLTAQEVVLRNIQINFDILEKVCVKFSDRRSCIEIPR